MKKKAPLDKITLLGLACMDGHRVAADAFAANGFLSKRAAMKKAGYVSNNTASVFNRPEVVEYVNALREAHRAKHEITRERILEELGTMAFTDFGDLIDVDPDTGDVTIDWTNLTPDQRKAMASLEIDSTETVTGDDGNGGNTVYRAKIKPKFYDKMAAISHICRILGLYNDRVEVTGADLVAELQAGRERARMRNAGATPDAE